PANAVEVADDVFSLGTARDVDGRLVEGFMFVDKGHNAKPPGAGAGKGGGGSTCFAFLANGAKWKTIESWVVNTANTEGLNGSFVFSNLAADIQKWEDSSAVNILGDGSTTNAILVADTASPDGQNEVYFGDVGSQGAIAVTIVWGIFAGPPSQRQLVEWDQVYDQADFDWSATGEAGKMDFENIATHEIGHSDGMGHPDDSCTEETMYRFAAAGETKKRTLNAGDIAGIQVLY
ncbi:MAG: matrixin family metalloprotease, partial [Candidatus Aenigmatarchaeota archaeon]